MKNNMEKEFVMTKRICKTTWDEYQFLTSTYPNRDDEQKMFGSVDGMWATDFLPDLKDNEADLLYSSNDVPDPRQGIEVEMHISREPKEGYRKMWCYGFVGRSRLITQYKPRFVRKVKDGTTACIKHGSIYIDNWCTYDRFPDIPEGAVFPVYVKITRKENKL